MQNLVLQFWPEFTINLRRRRFQPHRMLSRQINPLVSERPTRMITVVRMVRMMMVMTCSATWNASLALFLVVYVA